MPVDKPTREQLRHWNRILLENDLGNKWVKDCSVKLCTGGYSKFDEDTSPAVPTNYTLEGERKDARRGNFNIPSMESRLKMSESHKGHKHSEETKAKMSKAHLGKRFSRKHKAAIKAAALTRTPRATTPNLCGHLDRKHYAQGKCHACWRADYKKRKRE